MKRTLAVLWCCCACGTPDQGPVAKRWPTELLVSGARAGKTFGGFPTRMLVDLDGGVFLRVLPAFEDGQPAAFVVTDLWENHPAPWMQPVYSWQGRPDLPTIFGVGTGSGFYSPFWQHLVATPKPGATPDGATDVDQVLALGTIEEAELKVCPMVPKGLGFSNGTGLNLAEVRVGHAWTEGQLLEYRDFGGDRITAPDEGVPDESKLFAFTRPDGGLWPLPMVLPSGAFTRSYTRRYDVKLRPAWAVYPAANDEALRTELSALGVATAPSQADGGLDPDRLAAFVGRVALNGECFDGGFPEACQWLDSQAAIETQLTASQVVPSNTTASSPKMLVTP